MKNEIGRSNLVEVDIWNYVQVKKKCSYSLIFAVKIKNVKNMHNNVTNYYDYAKLYEDEIFLSYI